MEDELKFLADLTPLQLEEYGLEKLKVLLNQIPLESMNHGDNILTLVKLLKLCQSLNIEESSIVKTILIRWCNHDVDIDGVIGDLAANMTCDSSLLKYLVKIFPNSTPVNILDTHIRSRYGSGMVFSLVSERVLEAMDCNLEKFEWEYLMNVAEETKEAFQFDPKFIDRQSYSVTRNNKDVIEYIESKINSHKRKRMAPVPEWVSILDGESDAKYENYDDVNQIGMDDELMELKNTLTHLTNAEKMKDSDLGDEAPITKEEVADVFMSLKANSYKEMREFPYERYSGPANSIIGHNCMNAPNGIGPCRMLKCLCREHELTEGMSDEQIESITSPIWFHGQCDFCHRGIRKFSHSVRFPIDGGGWLGCYCSFKCVKEDSIRPLYDNDLFRISQIEEVLKISGIYDR